MLDAADEGRKVEKGPGGFYRFQLVSDAEEGHSVETNFSRPVTDAVITIRIIKSFAYRSMKAFVLKHVDLTTTTVDQLRAICQEEVRKSPVFKPFRSWVDKFDTLKIYTRAHGAKTTNLIVNLDHPDWVLREGEKTLQEVGLENEAELSLFHWPDYEEFIQNPETKW
ncbi:hypothetical protein CBS101457_003810 [Exobasidium rhododendri]|nr:hypothetical protein CBS101457_003810 [Exobasidium rhododendri]